MTSYESDFYQWTQEQAVLLRTGALSELDVLYIAEEIESVGNSHRHAVESYLRNIIMHLLKWKHQSKRRGESWRLSIDTGRHQIAKHLDESPSLRPRIPLMILKEYSLARRYAAHETKIPISIFPETCPFTPEQVLGEYWPD
jgi:hypothetical protein